jgi:cobalt-zinc-cadmium efflux system outer membrane protein
MNSGFVSPLYRIVTILLLATASPLRPATADTLTVDEAVAQGVAQNLELLAERFAVPIAEARLVAARLRPNPSLSAGADHLDLLGTNYDEDNAAGPPEYSGRFDYTVETGKKRTHRIELARREIAVARWQLKRAIQQRTLEIQEAAVNVQLARMTLDVAQANHRAFTKFVELSRHRHSAGDISQVELTRSEVLSIQFENAVLTAEREHGIAREKLQRLLARTGTSSLVDIEGPPVRERDLMSLDALERLAFEERPDLRAVREELVRAQADLELQRSIGQQDITLGSEYRRQNGLAGRGDSLGFFVSTPLAAYDRNQGEVARARQELERSAVLILAKENEIRQEARVAHRQGETAMKVVSRLEKGMLEKSQQVLDTMMYSYQRGEATFLDVLEARRAQNDTQATYNEARADLARALYRIDCITGRSPPP